MLTDSRDIIRRLEREGWVRVRVKGSHHQYKNPATGRRTTVTHPRKDMPIGTVRAIYEDAGWSRD